MRNFQEIFSLNRLFSPNRLSSVSPNRLNQFNLCRFKTILFVGIVSSLALTGFVLLNIQDNNLILYKQMVKNGELRENIGLHFGFLIFQYFSLFVIKNKFVRFLICQFHFIIPIILLLLYFKFRTKVRKHPGMWYKHNNTSTDNSSQLFSTIFQYAKNHIMDNELAYNLALNCSSLISALITLKFVKKDGKKFAKITIISTLLTFIFNIIRLVIPSLEPDPQIVQNVTTSINNIVKPIEINCLQDLKDNCGSLTYRQLEDNYNKFQRSNNLPIFPKYIFDNKNPQHLKDLYSFNKILGSSLTSKIFQISFGVLKFHVNEYKDSLQHIDIIAELDKMEQSNWIGKMQMSDIKKLIEMITTSMQGRSTTLRREVIARFDAFLDNPNITITNAQKTTARIQLKHRITTESMYDEDVDEFTKNLFGSDDIPDPNMDEVTKQSVESFVRALFNDYILPALAAIVASIYCIFTKKDFLTAYTLVEKHITTKGTSIIELWDKHIMEIDPEKDYLAEIQLHVDNMNNFLEQHSHTFGHDKPQFRKFKKQIERCEQFLRLTPKDFKHLTTTLQGLYVAASNKKNEYMTSYLQSTIRQQPTCVIVCGTGGIGKTQWVHYLIDYMLKNHYKTPRFEDVIEITPNDKYWPPLAGQRIALFDEVMSTTTIEKDLLLGNFKGIVSNVYFNAAASDNAHKINPIDFELIFATTNATPKEIVKYIAEYAGNSSIESYLRRCLLIEARRPQTYIDHKGQINRNNPEENTYDESEEFSHLEFVKWEYEPVVEAHNSKDNKVGLTGTVLPRKDKIFTPQEVKDSIEQRFQFYQRQYNADLAKNMENQKQTSIDHFVVNLTGKTFSGKSYLLSQHLSNFSFAVNLPVVHVSEKDLREWKPTSKRAIYVFDDVFKGGNTEELSQYYMDFFNNGIGNNSIIFQLTNLKPNFFIPIFTWTNSFLKTIYNVNNPGVLRRLGLVMPCYNGDMNTRNLNLNVVNRVVYQPDEFYVWPYLTKLNVFLVSLILICVYFYSIFFLIIPFIYQTIFMYLTYNRALQGKLIQDPADLWYTKYVSYMNANKQVIERIGNVDRVQNPNLVIKVFDKSNFKLNDTVEILKHLDSYSCVCPESLKNSWFLYIPHDILLKMENNTDKFMYPTVTLTKDNVKAIMKHYAAAFVDIGEIPKFDVQIVDIGSFTLIDNILTESATNGNVLIRESGITNDSVKYILTTGHESWEIDISLSGYDDFLLTTDVIPYTVHEIATFQRFIREGPKSDELLKRLSETRTNKIMTNLGSRLASVYQLWNKFKSSKYFPVIVFLFFLFGSVTIMTVLFKIAEKLFFDDSNSDSSSESEEEKPKYRKFKKKTKGKGSKKYTDDEHQSCGEQKRKKKGKGEKKYTDDELNKNVRATPVPKECSRRQILEKQSISTLGDMNSHSAFYGLINSTLAKATPNLGFIYATRKDYGIETSQELYEDRLNYSLGLAEKYLISVGHILDIDKERKYYYYRSDETKISYRLTLVKRVKYRDISIWEIESNKFCFRSLRKNLISRENIEPKTSLFFGTLNRTSTAILARYSSKNKLELIGGDMEISLGPNEFNFPTGSEIIHDIGSCGFGTFGPMLTTFGDCGLPYYLADTFEPTFNNKIIGIHCVGNSIGGSSRGVAAIFTVEDFDLFIKPKLKNIIPTVEEIVFPKQTSDCKFCPFNNFILTPSEKPQDISHEILWGINHEIGNSSLEQEVLHYSKIRPRWEGKAWKNVNCGSHAHTHTQFMNGNFNFPNQLTTWRKIHFYEHQLERCKEEQLYSKTFAGSLSSLTKFISNNGWMSEYVIQVNKTQNKYKFGFRVIVLKTDLSEEELAIKFQTSQKDSLPDMNAALIPLSGSVVYVEPNLHKILEKAKLNKELGKPHDVPFERIENNQTVEIYGTFARNESPIPTNHFKMSPYSKMLEPLVPIEKKPFNPEPKMCKDELQLEQLIVNNFGKKCPRATQSIMWAHVSYGLPIENKSYINNNFLSGKILKYYTNLELLSVEQIIGGFPINHPLRPYGHGLELAKSAGFTMQHLFQVTKKEDFIHLDELGNYTIKDNDAGKWFSKQLQIASNLQDEGIPYAGVFVEYSKMEKLKLSKEFLGRNFCAQDMIPLCMERRALLDFCIRAMRDDPECGVGMDPRVQFNKLGIAMSQCEKYFSVDYKRWDKTLPFSVMNDITKMLMAANPNIAKQLKAALTGITVKLHASGHTLFTTTGGMPSGCLVTAPLNSLANDYITYSCWSLLMQKKGLDSSWKAYDEEVYRQFYGDDAIIGLVGDSAKLFTRSKFKEIANRIFGMFIDSAEKTQGVVSDFDKWEELSWVSRYITTNDAFPIYFGALKKISIGAHYHYLKDQSDEYIVGMMEKAQDEAARWDHEYYNKIFTANRRICARNEKIAKLFTPRCQFDILCDVYCEVINFTSRKHSKQEILQQCRCDFHAKEFNKIPRNSCDAVDLLSDTEKLPKVLLRYIQSRSFSSYSYQLEHNKAPIDITNMSYIMQINELFQKGIITKPEYSFNRNVELVWTCQGSCKIVKTGYIVEKEQRFSTKAGAKELTCREMLSVIVPTIHEVKKHGGESFKQMDLTPAAALPQPTAPSADATVSSGNTIWDNAQQIASRVFDTTMSAVNNPFGTGAPFNASDACFHLMKEMTDKRTAINGTLPEGSVVLEIGLKPHELPAAQQAYVNLHSAIAPEIEGITIISGAAGTVGLLKVGIVRRDTDAPTLNNLEDIKCEVLTMNNAQVICWKLKDARKTDLYRENDGMTNATWEPSPKICFLIDAPFSNVQRNNDVDYPVRTYCRLSPNYGLWAPVARNTTPTGTTIDLQSVIKSPLDVVLVGGAVPSKSTASNVFEDQGWASDTSTFHPVPTVDNMRAMQFSTAGVGERKILSVFTNVGTEDITDANLAGIEALGVQDRYLVSVWTAHGETTREQTATSDVIESHMQVTTDTEPIFNGTIYTVPEIKTKLNGVTFICTQVLSNGTGCYCKWDADYVTQNYDYDQGGIQKSLILIVYSYEGPASADKFQWSSDLADGYYALTRLSEHQSDNMGNWFILTISFPFSRGYDSNAPGILPTLKGYDMRVTTSETFTYPTITYIQTGNTWDMTALAGDLKQIALMKQGTSSTNTTVAGIQPISKPGSYLALAMMDGFAQAHNTDAIVFNFGNTSLPLGTMAYSRQLNALIARSSSNGVIRPSVSNVDLKCTNVRAISNPSLIANLNASSWQSWFVGAQKNVKRHQGLWFKQAFAGELITGALGAGLSAIGGSLASQRSFQQQIELMGLQNKNDRNMLYANAALYAKQQKQDFDRKYELLGAKSASMQYGIDANNASREKIASMNNESNQARDNQSQMHAISRDAQAQDHAMNLAQLNNAARSVDLHTQGIQQYNLAGMNNDARAALAEKQNFTNMVISKSKDEQAGIRNSQQQQHNLERDYANHIYRTEEKQEPLNTHPGIGFQSAGYQYPGVHYTAMKQPEIKQAKLMQNSAVVSPANSTLNPSAQEFVPNAERK